MFGEPKKSFARLIMQPSGFQPIWLGDPPKEFTFDVTEIMFHCSNLFKLDYVLFLVKTFELRTIDLKQRYSTLSPITTCGDKHFNCDDKNFNCGDKQILGYL